MRPTTDDLGSVKHLVPWWAKIAAKLVLSRVPVPFSFWRQVGIFRHGRMNQGRHALRIFRKHCKRLGALAGC